MTLLSREARVAANSRVPSGVPLHRGPPPDVGYLRVAPEHIRRVAQGAFEDSSSDPSSGSECDELRASLRRHWPRRPLLQRGKAAHEPAREKGSRKPSPAKENSSPPDSLVGAKDTKQHTLWDMVNASGNHESQGDTGWDGLGPDHPPIPGPLYAEASSRSSSPAMERESLQHEPVRNRFGAVSSVAHDMLQMKYGLVLDLDDMVRKVEACCGRNEAPQAFQRKRPATTPDEVVDRLNTVSGVQFRASQGHCLVSLHLRSHPLSTYADLLAEVRRLNGTAHTIAVIDLSDVGIREGAIDRHEGTLTAVAVFREDYGRRDCLVGRSLSSGSGLYTFGASAFRSALKLDPEVTKKLHCATGSSKLVEERPPLPREEYKNLDLRLFPEKAGPSPRPLESPASVEVQPHQTPDSPAAYGFLEGLGLIAGGGSKGSSDKHPRSSVGKPPPPPPTVQFMSTLRNILENNGVTPAYGEQALIMLKQLGSWMDTDAGSGPRTAEDAAMAMDSENLQHGLVIAVKNGSHEAGVLAAVQAARCIGLALRNTSLGPGRFTSAGCVPALCDLLQSQPQDEDVQRTVVFAIRHIVEDPSSAIEALYIGASREVAAAAHRYPALVDLQTNSAQAIQLMGKHREKWMQQQGSQSSPSLRRPPSPPPNPAADWHPPAARSLQPPALQMPVPNLFSNGWLLHQAPPVAVPQAPPVPVGGPGLSLGAPVGPPVAFSGAQMPLAMLPTGDSMVHVQGLAPWR